VLLLKPVGVSGGLVLVLEYLYVLRVLFVRERVVDAETLFVVDFDEGAVVIGWHVVESHVVVVGVAVLKASSVLAALRVLQVRVWQVASFIRLVRIDWVQTVRFDEHLLRYVDRAMRVK